MSKVRGVRFTEPEEKLIEEFLRKNSLFDFSTLAKIAILSFVKNPSIQLVAVEISDKKEHQSARTISQ